MQKQYDCSEALVKTLMSKILHSEAFQKLSMLQVEAATGSVPNQDVTAMKLRLANAVHRSAGSSNESSKRSHSSESRDSLLDDLLALPPPQHSR